MPGPRRRVGTPVGLAALTALVLCWTGTAQDKKDTPGSGTAKAVAGQPGMGSTTLYLVLRAGPDETEKGILATLKQGLDKSGATISGEPGIRSISPAVFQELQGLVDRAGPTATAADDGNVTITALVSRDVIYEIRVKPSQVIKTLRVKYQKGGEKEYKPTSPSAEKSPLTLTTAGRYAFTPEQDDTPVSYQADVSELGKPDAVVKGEWPKGDKYFVVTMRNFVGDRKKLFEVIQDPKQVANPLDSVELGSDVLLAFASLNSSVPPGGDAGPDAEGYLNLWVENLRNRNPRRAWVYFPLDQQAMEKARAEYRKFDSLALPKEIRNKQVPADQMATVAPTDEPKWYELTPNPGRDGGLPQTFSRKVKLDKIPEFTEKYPRLFMLVVWEFQADDNSAPEAIQVRTPNDERVFVLERERQGWQKGTLTKPKDKDK